MSLKFKLIKKNLKTFGSDTVRQIYTARPVWAGRISFEKLCQLIADGSTVVSADVKAVLDRLNKVMSSYLPEGFIIDCGELGTFRPTFGSKAVEKEEEFKMQKHLRRARVAYRPNKEYTPLHTVRYERWVKKPSSQPTGSTSAETPNGGQGSTSNEGL